MNAYAKAWEGIGCTLRRHPQRTFALPGSVMRIENATMEHTSAPSLADTKATTTAALGPLRVRTYRHGETGPRRNAAVRRIRTK